ncbi:hypothetical protein ACVIGB_001045 [Bradyrhizobium sp. USDA 4341]
MMSKPIFAALLGLLMSPATAQFAPLTPINPGASHDTVPLRPLDPAGTPKVPLGQLVPQEAPQTKRLGTLVCPAVANASAGALIRAACNFNPALPGPVSGYSVSVTLSAAVPSSVGSGSLVWSVVLPALLGADTLSGDYDGADGVLAGGPTGAVSLIPLNIPGASTNLAPYALQARLDRVS